MAYSFVFRIALRMSLKETRNSYFCIIVFYFLHKFYNSLIPLKKIWPRLSSKYFGKLSDIY